MYWQTSLITLAFFLVYLLIASLTNRHYHWLNTFNLVLISLLVALSIVLTNLIGYSRIILGKQIELGNFLILVAGMLFGPWGGLLTAIVSDLVGSMIFVGGTFHIGFMISKIGFGVLGALIFTKFGLKWWFVKLVVVIITAILIQVLLIHPLALYGTMVWNWTNLWARFLLALPNKIITVAIESLIYPLLAFISFRVIYLLYIKRHSHLTLWCDRYGLNSWTFLENKSKKSKRTKFPIQESSN